MAGRRIAPKRAVEGGLMAVDAQMTGHCCLRFAVSEGHGAKIRQRFCDQSVNSLAVLESIF